MACRTGCLTKDHSTFGECARAASIQIDRHGLAGHRAAEKDKDNRLDRYAAARKAGLQPANTNWDKIHRAEEIGR